MRKITLFCLSLLCFTAYAQVGVGTASPRADLHVEAKATLGTGEYNGIIVPKVSSLPGPMDAAFPTDQEAGLIIYLNSNSSTEGFYFFNGTEYQNVTDLLEASNSGVFFNNGTTDIATNTTTAAERDGRLSIGSSLDDALLNLEVNSAQAIEAKALRIDNGNTGSLTDDTYGIQVNNDANNSGVAYGISSDIGTASTGDKTGFYSEITPAATRQMTRGYLANIINAPVGSDGSEVFGFKSNIGRLRSGNSISYGFHTAMGEGTAVGQTNYGLWASVGDQTSRGVKYGVYAVVANTGVEDAYSGYFQGANFTIRNADNSSGYEMPTSDGPVNAVLTTDGMGEASWIPLPATPTEIDGDTANEGLLSVGTVTNGATISSNTVGSETAIFRGSGGNTITETGNTIVVAAPVFNGTNGITASEAGGTVTINGPTYTGSNGITATESGGTVTISNTAVVKNIVTLDLWGNTGSLYGITPNSNFVDRAGIQTVFDSSTISTTGNLEVRLMIDQQDNANNGSADYQLKAYDNVNNISTPILDSNTNFQNNNVTGAATITTTGWRPFDAGMNGIAKFILQARNTGDSNANLRAVYLLIRNRD